MKVRPTIPDELLDELERLTEAFDEDVWLSLGYPDYYEVYSTNENRVLFGANIYNTEDDVNLMSYLETVDPSLVAGLVAELKKLRALKEEYVLS